MLTQGRQNIWQNVALSQPGFDKLFNFDFDHSLDTKDIHKFLVNLRLCHHQILILGVIQQLSGINFTQFWPPTPLEWTKMNILHTIEPLSYDPPPTPLLVHIVIYWPLTFGTPITEQNSVKTHLCALSHREYRASFLPNWKWEQSS